MPVTLVGPASVAGSDDLGRFRLDANTNEAAIKVLTPDRGQVVRYALILLWHGCKRFQLKTVKVFAHDDIDNAGNRVGTVDGGSTVQQQIVLLDQRTWYEIEIGRKGRPFDARWCHTPAVDEYQGTGRTQSPQADRVGARAFIDNEAAERQVDLLARRCR